MIYLDIGSHKFYQTEFYLSYFDTSGHLTKTNLHLCDKESSKECRFTTDWIEINKNDIIDNTLYIHYNDVKSDEMKYFYDNIIYITQTIITNILLNLGAVPNNIRYDNEYFKINLSKNASSKMVNNDNTLLYKFIWKCNIYIMDDDVFIITAEICDIETKDKEIVEFDDIRIRIYI